MKITGNKSGFTLIELVMVIAILGILSAVALPRFYDLQGSARDAAGRGALGAMRSAIAASYANSATTGNATYPATITPVLFAGATMPRNPFNNSTAVANVAAPVAGTVTSVTNGFWYVNAAGADQG